MTEKLLAGPRSFFASIHIARMLIPRSARHLSGPLDNFSCEFSMSAPGVGSWDPGDGGQLRRGRCRNQAGIGGVGGVEGDGALGAYPGGGAVVNRGRRVQADAGSSCTTRTTRRSTASTQSARRTRTEVVTSRRRSACWLAVAEGGSNATEGFLQ